MQRRILPLIIFTCFCTEAFCLIQGKTVFGIYTNPIIFFTSGLLIVILPVFLPKKEIPVTTEKKGFHKYFVTAVWLGVSVSILILAAHSMKKYPIDVNYSDILPTLDIMSSRLLKDGMVYRDVVIYSTYTGGYPGYLPMHWLPAVIPKYFGIDIRWAVISIFIIGLSGYYFWLRTKTTKNITATIVSALTPAFFSLLILAKMEQVAVGTAELMIAGYFILLCVGIVSNNMTLLVAGIVCCLLSRYSLILWLPLYFILLWINEGRNRTIRLLLYLAGLICLLFILPFFWQNPTAFSGIIKSYTHNVPMYEWGGQYWQAPGDKPYQLFQGLGMACFVYDNAKSSIEHKISFLLKLQIILSCSSVLIAGWWYYYKRKRNIDHKFLSLLALKFYFCFFYGFMVVPYSYLFWVPLFVSVVILSYVFIEYGS